MTRRYRPCSFFFIIFFPLWLLLTLLTKWALPLPAFSVGNERWKRRRTPASVPSLLITKRLVTINATANNGSQHNTKVFTFETIIHNYHLQIWKKDLYFNNLACFYLLKKTHLQLPNLMQFKAHLKQWRSLPSINERYNEMFEWIFHYSRWLYFGYWIFIQRTCAIIKIKRPSNFIMDLSR